MGHVSHICGKLTNLHAGKESFVLEAKLHTHAAQLRQQRVLHSADLCQISIVQEGSVTMRSEHWIPQVQKDAQQIQLARLKVGDCEDEHILKCWNVQRMHKKEDDKKHHQCSRSPGSWSSYSVAIPSCWTSRCCPSRDTPGSPTTSIWFWQMYRNVV